jgi:hypothetical protein
MLTTIPSSHIMNLLERKLIYYVTASLTFRKTLYSYANSIEKDNASFPGIVEPTNQTNGQYGNRS